MNKRIPKAIFSLNRSTEPSVEGLALDSSIPSNIGRGSLRDDLSPGFGVASKDPNWSQISLLDAWHPPKVEGNLSPQDIDYPCINLIIPAFSRRACEALGDFLNDNGELLPLDTDRGEYFFYNITTVVDALDREKSECDFWCDPPTTTFHIAHFAFHENKLEGLSIFRIREYPAGVFVSAEFVNRAQSHGLVGLDFAKVWPCKIGIPAE